MTSTDPRSPSLGPDLRGRELAGRYHLEEIVGRGGTASVYAALDSHMRRRVAVKVIHPEHARAEAQRRRIRQEARVGGALDHPHLTPVLDFGKERTADGEALCFLVMPLLEGRTLNELVYDGALPWRRCVGLARQLLAAVAALHSAGVIHRDLKASNCLVSRHRGVEHLRVLDLGLAKVSIPSLASSAPLSTSCGRFVGTLAYAAPEQVLERAVDNRVDLYAVGVILFFLLTRRLPFTGTDYEVRRAVVETPPALHELAPATGIPTPLAEIVLRALAKDPDERFACADDFDAALVEVLAAEGVSSLAALRPCPRGHRGADEAQAALAAWTCFDYERARGAAARAAEVNGAWSPLALLMSLVPEEA